MLKRMIIMLALLAIVTSAFIGWKSYTSHEKMKQMSAGFTPPSVSTIVATTKDWQSELHAVGTLKAVNGADLSSEVSGIVEEIKFQSGADVEANTPLVQLRAEDDSAKLLSLQAAEKLAGITFDRDQKQLKAQAVSQATVDTDAATLASAKAQVAAQQAILDKKTIRAPFAGHLGIRQVDVGQYLTQGTAIVTLQQLDPIYADFNLPEDSLTQLSLGQKIAVSLDAHPDKVFEGKVDAINSKVDEATRNVLVRATLDNHDHSLLPGMFANITVDAGAPVRFVTIPQTAVVFNTYGNTVYRVQKGADDNAPLSAEQVVVVTGEKRGDQISVLSGVKDGDQIVTSGQVKLRNGSPVIINNDVQPTNEPNPTPHEQ